MAHAWDAPQGNAANHPMTPGAMATDLYAEVSRLRAVVAAGDAIRRLLDIETDEHGAPYVSLAPDENAYAMARAVANWDALRSAALEPAREAVSVPPAPRPCAACGGDPCGHPVRCDKPECVCKGCGKGGMRHAPWPAPKSPAPLPVYPSLTGYLLAAGPSNLIVDELRACLSELDTLRAALRVPEYIRVAALYRRFDSDPLVVKLAEHVLALAGAPA